MDEFKIQKYTEYIKVSLYPGEYDYGRQQLYAVSAYFVQGKQLRTQFKEVKKVEKTINVPASAFDWLKTLIITFEPSLSFGWLIPKTIELEKKVTINQQSSYINIYPIELNHPAIKNKYFTFPSPYDWLTGEPPTKDDVFRANQKIDEMKWSASRLALWLVDERIDIDFSIKEQLSRRFNE